MLKRSYEQLSGNSRNNLWSGRLVMISHKCSKTKDLVSMVTANENRASTEENIFVVSRFEIPSSSSKEVINHHATDSTSPSSIEKQYTEKSA